MKYITFLSFIALYSCSFTLKNRVLDWKEIAFENGHSYYEDSKDSLKVGLRTPSAVEKQEIDSCADQTSEELKNLDKFILNFGGKVHDPNEYDFTVNGLQEYLTDSNLTQFFNAKEMVRPNKESVARGCGHKNLLPSRCRWKSAIAQGLLAVKLRSVINEGEKTKSGISIRNWWRPNCYNQKVGGAKSSDHIQARGFDLDFKTPTQRAKAQSYICSLYKDEGSLSIQVGIGCQTLHVGIGSPKRLNRYPSDGSRFWKYGSLKNCSIKRVKADDCWKLGKDNKLHIYTEEGSGVL